jgi:YVTN family beta-propeller protein
LAALLVHRGEIVSSDRLVDALWGERAPATAIKIVQGYVSNLRKVLGGSLLMTHGHGYLLAVEPGQIDADRFASLVDEGRRALQAGDPRTAADRLREALTLWRGPPLADFTYQSFAQEEIARLTEARLAVVEERVEAELQLGEHAQIVAELEALVHEYPLRERVIGQLMLALYRSGRQADALEVYRDARRRLVDELGIEPSRELNDLEQAILAHDPALEPVRKTGRRPAPVHRRRAPAGIVIAAGGVVLAVAITALALRLSGSGGDQIRVPANSLAAIDVRSNQVVGFAPLGTRPGGVAFGAGSLWVTNSDDKTVSRVNPRPLRTIATIPVSGAPTAIATSPRAVWVVDSILNPGVNPQKSSVVVDRVDPEFNAPGRPVRIHSVVPSGPGAIATQGNSVWVAPSTGLLTRLSATNGAIGAQLDPNATPAGLAIGAGAMWLTDSEANQVVRIDPTGFLTPIPVGNGPHGIAVGAGAVWVVDSLDDSVVRIDPSSRAITETLHVGRSPAGLAFGAGSVWVANAGDGTVTRIDAHTNSVQTIAVGGSPQAIAVVGGRAWVTVDAQTIGPAHGGPDGTTLRIASSSDVDFMDPALAYDNQSWELLYATCAKLVNYRDAGGAAGAQLAPEVARSLPARSPDGRTYTFRIRSDFRFSPASGQRVTAQTFKTTIERTLSPRMHSPAGQYLANVVGATAYMAGKASHITGVTANGDTLTIQLLRPTPDLLARLAEPAFCAVPSNTPIQRDGVRVIPSAGPYYVSSYSPGQGVILLRNPNYHGRRPRRFARIEFAAGVASRRALRDINASTADYTSLGLDSSVSADAIARLATRFGSGSAAAIHGRQRYFVNPILELDFFILNTERGVFRDVRMRRAVNYAIDRRRLASYGSGIVPLPERPTDHYLPPGIPGFRDAHIYPLTPDLAKARQLVRLAHATGRSVVLYTYDAPPGQTVAQIVKTELVAIGLQVQIKVFPTATQFSRLATPGEPYDIGFAGWQTDYPDPSQMLNLVLESGALAPPLRDPAIARPLARAAALSGPERYRNYGRLDVALARDAAPLAAFGNAANHDFFSARIGCETFGVYGVNLGALCLRPRQT